MSLIKDSKKLSEKKRNEFVGKFLLTKCKFGLGFSSNRFIDKTNISFATFEAMRKSIVDLDNPVDFIFVDGDKKIPNLDCEQFKIIKGDDKSLSIAAASIIAKVHRDRLMKKLSLKYQDFGWEKNSGYGTKMHIENIYRLGPTIHHRKTFEPIKSLIHN